MVCWFWWKLSHRSHITDWFRFYMSLKLSSSHCLSPSCWSRWTLEQGHAVLTCTSVEDTLVSCGVVQFLNLRGGATVLIALSHGKCLALALEWAAVTSELDAWAHPYTSYLGIADSSSGRRSRNELCTALGVNDFCWLQSLNQDSRRTTGVFTCSVTPMEAAQGISSSTALPSPLSQARLAHELPCFVT